MGGRSSNPSTPARVSLLRTKVLQCKTGCLAYNGGQIALEEGSSVIDCGVGVSACDRGSCVAIACDVQIVCSSCRNMQEFGGGTIHFAAYGMQKEVSCVRQ